MTLSIVSFIVLSAAHDSECASSFIVLSAAHGSECASSVIVLSAAHGSECARSVMWSSCIACMFLLFFVYMYLSFC